MNTTKTAELIKEVSYFLAPFAFINDAIQASNDPEGLEPDETAEVSFTPQDRATAYNLYGRCEEWISKCNQ